MKRILVAAVLAGLLAAGWLALRQTNGVETASRPEPAQLSGVTAPSPRESAPPATGSREHGNVHLRVLTKSGAPIANAELKLWSRGRYNPAQSRYRWTPLPSLSTDAAGLAETTLEAGSYFAAVHGVAPVRKSFARLPGEALTQVELRASAPAQLEGNTLDARTREPVPLVQLTLTEVPAPDVLSRDYTPEEEQIHASSDAQGRFVVQNLAAGAYRIEAEAPGYGKARVAEIDVPRAGPALVLMRAAAFVQGKVTMPGGGGAAGAEITLTRDATPWLAVAGNDGAFSVQLEPGPFLLTARSGNLTGGLPRTRAVKSGETLDVGAVALQAGGKIEATVVDRKGDPVEDAEVIVSPYLGGGMTGTARTGKNGVALIESVPEGAYDFDVFADGYSRYLRRGLLVGPGQTVAHKAVMSATGVIEGTVRNGSGALMPGIYVRASPVLNGTAEASAPVATRTDERGRFRLPGVSEGQVAIVAQTDEKGATKIPDQVYVVIGRETIYADLTLDDTATVSGRILGAEAGQRIVVRARLTDKLRSLLETTVSPLDGDGRYQVKLGAGTWALQAIHPGASGVSEETHNFVVVSDGQREPEGLPGAGADVQWIHPGEKLELDLQLNHSNDAVTGTVLELGDAPSPRAIVMIHSGGSLAGYVTTDEDGHFRLERPGVLPEGATLVARKGGRIAEVPVGAGELVLRLKNGASLHGAVTSNGKPVSGFSLKIVSLDAPTPWLKDSATSYAVSGSDFRIDELAAGRSTLTCTLDDGATATQEITLDEGEERALNLDVAAAGHITGRIVDKSGAPAAALTVNLVSNGGTQSAQTDGAGAFSFAINEPGSVRIHAMALTGRRVSVTLEAGAGDLDAGTLTLEPRKLWPGQTGLLLGDGLQVLWVNADGPPAAAGVQAGDILLSIDSQPVKDLESADKYLRGEPGTTVLLGFDRGGQSITVELRRSLGTPGWYDER